VSERHDDLTAVVTALDILIEDGGDLLERHHLDAATELRARIDERIGHGDAVTVVALAGGTGVGKSALVNRLVGTQVTTEGVLRPTTGHPVAVTHEVDGPTRALLDHLGIHDRRTVPGGLPPGLVLVDLPDHDSVVEAHRTTSGRLAGRVDALLVVVDPLKYARADLHHGPLAELRRHAEVVTVALNRSDEVDEADVDRIRRDLADRLEADGLGAVEVVTTSASSGAGVETLRGHLERLSAARTAAVGRLVADAAQLADRIRSDVGEAPELSIDGDTLVAPLFEACDVGRSAAAAAVTYRRTARAGCRSPLARVARLPGRVVTRLEDAFDVTGPQAPRRSRSVETVQATLARHVDLTATSGTHHTALAATIDRISRDAAPQLVDTVDAVPLQPDGRAWWLALAWLRGTAEAVAAVGLLWLLLLGVSRWLQLPEVPTPMVTDVLSWPAALFLIGLLVRVVLGVLSRGLIALAARRHAAQVDREVRRRLTATLERTVLDPLRAELERRRTVWTQLRSLSDQIGSARPASWR
jgi:GTP-binding protein EngB required for normal cell division